MIRAFLFDFNGVIVDDEPLHFQLFQKVLGEEEVHLKKEDYYSKYLGMDDEDCFHATLKDQGKDFTVEKVREMIQRKSHYYQDSIQKKPPFVPGVLDFIKDLSREHFFAVVSGALRSEIEMLLQIGKVRDAVNVLVAAEDVERGKPDPEGYEKAFQALNRDFVASSEMLLPPECLVIEDSIWGIKAAQAAGMPCVAVKTSFSEKEMPGAQYYLKDFKGIDAATLIKNIPP